MCPASWATVYLPRYREYFVAKLDDLESLQGAFEIQLYTEKHNSVDIVPSMNPENSHSQQWPEESKQVCKKPARLSRWIQVSRDLLRQFIDGWIIKVFTEAIIQRQGSKSRAPVNKTTCSHKQLHLDAQLHVCHSRHAWPQSVSFQFSQTPTALPRLSVSLLFLLFHRHTEKEKKNKKKETQRCTKI